MWMHNVTTIVYWRTANFLVCSICQKLANCTFISNSRVKTSKLTPDKQVFSVGYQDLLVFKFYFKFKKKIYLYIYFRISIDRRDSRYSNNFKKSSEISLLSIIS
jgi:hypothetical protein